MKTVLLNLVLVTFITCIAFAQDPYPGTALEFDGTDDYVQIADHSSLDITGSITIEAWVYPRSAPASGMRILDKSYVGTSQAYLLDTHPNNQIRMIIASNTLRTTEAIPVNQWSHVAAVYNSAVGWQGIYINGELKASASGLSGNLSTNNNSVRLGANSDLTGTFFDGLMEEVRIWNTARTAQELRENMHLTLTGNDSGLVSYWQLNDSTGTTAVDLVGGNNGTLNNMNNSDWINSTTPIGGGSSFTQIVSTTGVFDFTGTNLSMDFSAKTGTDTIVVSILDLASNTTPLEYATFNSQYWIVNKFGSGTINTDLTFTPNEIITVDDETSPGGIRIFNRASNSEGNWSNMMGASATSASNNSVTFDNLTSFSQFLIGRQWFTDINAGLIAVNLSSVAWGDYDNDGDLDILITGQAVSSISRIYRNDAGAFTDINAGLTRFANGSAAWGDYDNDGDLDILLTGRASYSKIYRNDPSTGSGRVFTEINDGLVGVYRSSVAWGDYDNDGDLDILLTGETGYYPNNTTVSRIYRNDPSSDGNERIFTDINAQLVGVTSSSVAWGDYDNDGDLDILLTGQDSSLNYFTRIYRNDPSADGTDRVFTDINAGLTDIRYGSVAWGDYDNDGDLDILLTGDGSYRLIRIYRNDSGVFTYIHAGLVGVQSSSVAWGDYDNDGDLDILLSGNSSMTTNVSRIYRNDLGVFTDINAGLPGVYLGSVAWGDYDNDGDLDILLTGATTSNPYNPISRIYRNNSVVANSVPLSPGGLNAVLSAESLIFSWNKASDYETPQEGLSYNLSIGNDKYNFEVNSPMSDSSGYRLVPAFGNAGQVISRRIHYPYSLPHVIPPNYWSVQSIDHAYAGSPFATEKLNIPISYLPVLNNEIITLTDSLTWLNPSYTNSIISFRVQIDSDISFSNPIIDDIISITHNDSDTYSISLQNIQGNHNLVEGVKYYWRLKPNYTIGYPTTFTNPPPSFWFGFSGAASDTVKIDLTEGWNNIGGPFWDLSVNDIIDADSIVVPNTLYRYEDYYVSTDTISPGIGYWIMASDSGQITMIRGHNGSSNITNELINLDPFTSINISDGNGHSRKLYLNSNEQEIDNPAMVKRYALPPVTNQNMFDVRFTNGKYLCEGSETIIEVQSSDYPIEINISNLPHSDKFSYVLQEIIGEEIIKSHDLRDGETLIISQPQSNNSTTLKITKQSLIPETFALGQNYPNPFNPITTIPYALPEKAKVIIELYDMLGRKIKTLLNIEKNAGYHTFEFKPNNLASGVYIYRIQAAQFSAKKKLLLMK